MNYLFMVFKMIKQKITQPLLSYERSEAKSFLRLSPAYDQTDAEHLWSY